MQLVNTRSFEPHHLSLADIPPYAILPHAWGDSEMSFQEFPYPTAKKSYVKIEKIYELALKNGLRFAWTDICCIDKSSRAHRVNQLYLSVV
ncbi:hypothetical protein B0O99DRAFT_529872 [Bisporella sp. PMI_857]|nr:hypothetical protein B0O99DRAFT_529872 [Bisporella sp. PMI_857]